METNAANTDREQQKKSQSILKKKRLVVDTDKPVNFQDFAAVKVSSKRSSASVLETFSKAPRIVMPKNPTSRKIISLKNMFQPANKQESSDANFNLRQQKVPLQQKINNPYRSSQLITFAASDTELLKANRPLEKFHKLESVSIKKHPLDQNTNTATGPSDKNQTENSKPEKALISGGFARAAMTASSKATQDSKSHLVRQYHEDMTHRHKWSVLLQPANRAKIADSQVSRTSKHIRKTRPQSSSFIRANTLSSLEDGCRLFVNPDGQFKIYWEAIKLLLLLYTLFLVPFSAAFLETLPVPISFSNKILDVFFLADLALVFFTPVYSNHELVFDTKTITKHYLSGWFWLDLLALIPIEELIDLFSNPEHSFEINGSSDPKIRLWRLTKLLRLAKGFDFTDSDNMIMRIINSSFQQSIVGQVLPNILIMITFLHFFACTWYIVGSLEADSTQSWIFINGFQNNDVLRSYLISFYLMVASFTSCGYGDIIGNTRPEMVIKIVVIISGSLLYGIFLGRVTDYRSQLMESQERQELKLNQLAVISHKFDLDGPLKLALAEAINNLDISRVQTTRKPKLDFSALTREEYEDFEVLRLLHKYDAVPLIGASELPLHKKWILELGKQLEKKEYRADDIIYSKGEPATFFYILAQGTVTFMMDRIELVPMLRIKKGFFGEREILLQSKRSHTVIAESSTVIVYKLSRSEFKKIFLSGIQSNLVSPWSNKLIPAHHRNSIGSMRSFRSLQLMQGPKARIILASKPSKQQNSLVSGMTSAPKFVQKLNTIASHKPKPVNISRILIPSINGTSDSEVEAEDPQQISHKKFVRDLWTLSNKRHQQLNQLQKDFDFFLRRKMFWKLVLSGKKKKTQDINSIMVGSSGKQNNLAPANSVSTRN